jgi:hypothetical protein
MRQEFYQGWKGACKPWNPIYPKDIDQSTCSCTPSWLQKRASVTRAWTPPAVATSMLHLSSAAKFARAPAALSCYPSKQHRTHISHSTTRYQIFTGIYNIPEIKLWPAMSHHLSGKMLWIAKKYPQQRLWLRQTKMDWDRGEQSQRDDSWGYWSLALTSNSIL